MAVVLALGFLSSRLAGLSIEMTTQKKKKNPAKLLSITNVTINKFGG